MAWLAQVPQAHKEVAPWLSCRPAVALAWMSCSLMLQECGVQGRERCPKVKSWFFLPGFVSSLILTGAVYKMGAVPGWAFSEQP